MADSPDANLQLKKRARRRLVGAVAIAGLAAVVLPMVMDEEQKQQVQDVQIRIPGQDKAPPFAPKVAKPVAASADAEKPVAAEKMDEAPTVPAVAPPPAAKVAEEPAAKPVEKSAEKPAEKKPEKPVEKPPVKPAPKPAEKPTEKPAKANDSDAQRAAAILSGKSLDTAAGNGSSGQFVILIGAFSNPANVKQLQSKIGELGVKVYTESLDSTEGTKTRVRAGPFTSRDAADKALEKMKRIGVNGVVAAKQ